jgi:hypothetical protein
MKKHKRCFTKAQRERRAKVKKIWDLKNKHRYVKYEQNRKKKLLVNKDLREKRAFYQKEYGNRNRKAITLQQSKRMQRSIQLRLAKTLRCRLNRALKGNFKSGSSVSDLGCTIKKFKVYLESRFLLGMNWDNYGKGYSKWNIDHIKPLSKIDLTNRKEFLKAAHYTNMQPLWHTDNIKKGNR